MRTPDAGELMAPAVSVILNCYNHEQYVGEAIQSVLDQTFVDFELIIIDNGSTDGSRAIIERFHDPRIRLVLHDQNQSLSKRLNEGVALARGEFVAVLYSDDWMLPDKLERQLGIFGTLPPDYGVVYCPALGFNQHSGKRWQHPSMTQSGAILSRMLRHNLAGAIDMSSPLMRRECLQAYRWHEDLFGDGEAVLLRIAMSWKFHFDPQPTVVLRDHGGNMGKAIKKNSDMLWTILDRLEAHPDFPVDHLADLRAFRATISRNHAWTVLRMSPDDAHWARKRLWRALRLQPGQLFHPRLIAGLALSLLPSKLRALVNASANRIKPGRENRTLVEDY